ncbi:23S rRNA (adenine(2030)-N(6))-methyltransferase RlmJ [Shigella flexneri]
MNENRLSGGGSGIAEGYKRFPPLVLTHCGIRVVLRKQIKRRKSTILEATGIRKFCKLNWRICNSNRRGMTASGMIVINPPWKLEQQMNNVLPVAAQQTGSGRHRARHRKLDGPE